MNLKWLMRIMKYILSLMHFFYVGNIAIILLIIGIFNPFIQMVGVLVLALWLLLAAIDQVVLNKVMKDSPELQEVVNSMMANETSIGRMSVGTEVTFCSIPEEELTLVGRCLNEGGDWNVRLLYEDSYQMFDWDIVYNERVSPQMKLFGEMPGHENDILVKCYCRDTDGKARWQLHLLKRDGVIYKDIALDMINLIEIVGQTYKMEYVSDESLIYLECDGEGNPDFVTQTISIDNRTIGFVPVRMVYGNVTMIDMDKMKVKLSVGAEYEKTGIGQLADHYVVGDIVIGENDIKVSGIHIEI